MIQTCRHKSQLLNETIINHDFIYLAASSRAAGYAYFVSTLGKQKYNAFLVRVLQSPVENGMQFVEKYMSPNHFVEPSLLKHWTAGQMFSGGKGCT